MFIASVYGFRDNDYHKNLFHSSDIGKVYHQCVYEDAFGDDCFDKIRFHSTDIVNFYYQCVYEYDFEDYHYF